jgi:hypothetical protein
VDKDALVKTDERIDTKVTISTDFVFISCDEAVVVDIYGQQTAIHTKYAMFSMQI